MIDHMKTVDKSQFKCFQMPDQSVFYGDLVYLNTETNNIYFSLDEIESINNNGDASATAAS